MIFLKLLILLIVTCITGLVIFGILDAKFQMWLFEKKLHSTQSLIDNNQNRIAKYGKPTDVGMFIPFISGSNFKEKKQQIRLMRLQSAIDDMNDVADLHKVFAINPYVNGNKELFGFLVVWKDNKKHKYLIELEEI